MKNSDKTVKPSETDKTLYETLRHVMMAFAEAAGGFIERDSNTVAEMLEDCADASLEEKLEEYDGIWGGLENDVNETISEISDIYDSWIKDKQDEIISLFDDPFLKEKIIRGIALVELIVDKAKEAMENFYEFSGYPGVPIYWSKDGQFFIENARSDTPITLEEYEGAFAQIDLLFKQYERGGYAYELDKLSAEIRICMDFPSHFKLQRTHRSETVKPNDDEENATLLHFMQLCCEKQSLQSLRYRRKSLNDAHSRKAITLPDHIGKWKSGMTKRYEVKELIANWPNYREVLLNLPKLKPEHQ